MLELCRANLERIRRLLNGLEAETPLLNKLLQAALDGQGEVLRISPHRSVFRIDLPAPAVTQTWLVKLSHPDRDWEFLRRMVSTPPALRELENWQLLASRLGLEFPLDAQQLHPQVGLFVRPFFSGVRASEALPERSKDLAQGVAHLHGLRWSDRDLDAGDLLYADEFDGQLIPLDLGQARLGALNLPAELIYRDLARLLSGLELPLIRALANPLLDAHQGAEMLHGWTASGLIQRALRIRQRRTWERSARCLRKVSDFCASSSQARRRSFAHANPPAIDPAQILSSGPRSTTLLTDQVCWKMYPRPGLGQGIRKSMGLGPGRQAYRRLYWLELLGLQAARVQAWQASGQAEWVATSWVEGEPLQPADYPELARFLADLHLNGVSMRDPKPSNFVLGPERQIVLVDGDGLRNHSLDRGRDLARLIAECEPGSEQENLCLMAYQQSFAQGSDTEQALPDRGRMNRYAESFRQRLRVV
jgi:tRNA A-37 threonylcarbamoyl transferase component Bud32